MGRKRKAAKHDVYSDDEGSDEGGAKVDVRLDRVESYEYKAPENIDPDDDEEIEESDAFNSEDEDIYADHTFIKSDPARRKQRLSNSENILDEASGDEQDDDDSQLDDSEMMDLSEMLGQEDVQDKGRPAKISVPDFAKIASGSEDSDNDIEPPVFSSSASEGEDEGLDDKDLLQDLIQKLETPKSQAKRSRKRNITETLTETMEESEYNINTHRGLADDNEEITGFKRKVNMDELIGALPENTSFGNLKKKIVKLDIADRKSGLGETMAAPLHQRAHDRLNREAAYAEAKNQVKKWARFVQKNRQADSLKFTSPEVSKTTNNALVSKFKPEANSMEAEIRDILDKEGLSEKKQLELEQMEMNKLTKEEVANRRAELAKMRSLMFFQEQKQKKISKIKSKTYRKLHKKKASEDPEGMDIKTLKSLDPEAARERLIQMERARAIERMTLKHKNSGKWAKRMRGRDASSEALMDQLAKHDELKKRIQGYESGSDIEETAEDDDETAAETVAQALESIEKVKASIDESEVPDTGVFAMKFMRKHVEAEKEAARSAAQSLQDDLNGELGLLEDKEEEASLALGPRSFNSDSAAAARRKYATSEQNMDLVDDSSDNEVEGHALSMSGPISADTRVQSLEPLFEVEGFGMNLTGIVVNIFTASNTKTVKLDSSLPLSSLDSKTMERDVQADGSESVQDVLPEQKDNYAEDFVEQDEGSANPWLKSTDKPLLKSLKTSDSKFNRVGKQTKALEKLAKTRKEFLSADSTFLEESSDVIKGVDSNLVEPDALSPDTEAVEDQGEFSMVHNKDPAGLSQLQVMEMAFADDKIVEAFEAEKQSTIEQDKPKVEDATLPGWGCWSGNGIKAKKNLVTKTVKNADAVDPRKRRDAHLKHVIINEKRQKKTVKYLAPQVPHGFENRAQYERSIRAPLGKEWQTTVSHEVLSRPRVETVRGDVIHPPRRVGR